MRRSSAKHRLMNRTSQMFADDPDLAEFAATSTDVSALVASKLGKAPPVTDQKLLCTVLFGDSLKGKQVRESVDKDTSPQNSSAISTQVHYNFFIITSICCRVIVLGKLFTGSVPLFTKQRN